MLLVREECSIFRIGEQARIVVESNVGGNVLPGCECR